uniref:WD repeat-containing protein 89 n=1 Tax=Neogobius melanostomus TaxID=47308 RepID=A0A8C6SB28_9GOBI
VAVACSDFTLRLHDKRSLRRLRTLAGHTGPVSAVRFAHRSVSSFYSASLDGTVRLWDARSPETKQAQVFKSDASHCFSSFDLSCSDSLLCGGTEQVNGEDSFLVFWDVRKPGGVLLGVYSESHSDDITQVRFHPTDKDRLASGSTDGLVNVFDLSEGAEDEALVGTCNSESSVSALCWLGLERLLCVSHDEGLRLWDLKSLDTEDELTVYSTRDARVAEGQGSAGSALDYLIGGCWLDSEGQVLVVGGSGGGDVHLFTCDRAGLSPVRTLTSGHTATVRCFGFDSQSLSLFTGGEDVQLLRWSREETGSGPGGNKH